MGRLEGGGSVKGEVGWKWTGGVPAPLAAPALGGEPGRWAGAGGSPAPHPSPARRDRPPASIRASPHLARPPRLRPSPPARTAPAALLRPPARPPPALPGSLPVSLGYHRGAPGIAASKSRPTTQQRGHHWRRRPRPPRPTPPGRLSEEPARPAPTNARPLRRACPRPAGARRAAAGERGRGGRGAHGLSARPAPRAPALAPASRRPAARALLRETDAASGRQGVGAARARRGEAGGWVGAPPQGRGPPMQAQRQRLARGGVSSSLWGPGRWRERGVVLQRLALTACLCCRA